MKLDRCGGILLHPTSLPSPFGIGDFGEEAFRFLRQLSDAGQSLWQMLPLGPPGAGNSPYALYSAFAGNPLLISPEILARHGLLNRKEVDRSPDFPARSVDYERVAEWKLPLLKQAHRIFREKATGEQRQAFEQFCTVHRAWLEDYTLFIALKEHFGFDKNWTEWDKNLVQRKPQALREWREKLRAEIDCQQYCQFEFYRQWDTLRAEARRRGIKIMGDIPIYVSHDSADVWAHPEQFCLDQDGHATLVAGVPPDYFSKTGQLWGNPIYRWEEMERTGFPWWIERFRATFRLFDLVRLDHFRGFQAYWAVPASEKTAENGKWVKAPGAALFEEARKQLGELEMVAENLGDITPEVEQLRRDVHFPGMAVLQFAFGTDPQARTFLPYNYERNLFAYTGTHDNDTVVGWWNSDGGDSTRSAEDILRERAFALQYLGDDNEGIHWKLIRTLYSSVARVAVVPMQDVLGLSSESRMNKPGAAEGNWGWRMEQGEFSAALQTRLKEFAVVYGRAPDPKAK